MAIPMASAILIASGVFTYSLYCSMNPSGSTKIYI